MKNIVFTGGTFAGKTSVLRELSSRGYTVFESVAEQNIQQLIDLLGFEKYKKWRQTYFQEFQKMNIFAGFKDYSEAQKLKNSKGNMIFFDRGILDWFASLRREGYSIPIEIFELFDTKIIHYDIACSFEGLPTHEIRPETGRMLDETVSLAWKKLILKEYKKYNSQIISVPVLDISGRADYILSEIGKISI